MLGHPRRHFKAKGKVGAVVDVSWVSLGEVGIASGNGFLHNRLMPGEEFTTQLLRNLS